MLMVIKCLYSFRIHKYVTTIGQTAVRDSQGSNMIIQLMDIYEEEVYG